ncbi:MAG: glycosyltransferase, partial [Planctomycetes bacterium]|nr:glycosyltransferase [Planctomycetota bacterium]
MHVAFFIHNLHCGGAERVTALLAGGLCRRGYEVSILTLAGPQKPFYQLPVDVKIVPLDVYWGTDDLAKTFLL